MSNNQPGPARPIGHIRLALGEYEGTGKIASSLSAVEQVGHHLFIGADETASVERLTSTDHADYGRHVSYPLERLFPGLPGGAEGEADIEGLAYDEVRGHLWIMGSHSLRQGKPRKGADGVQALSDLARIPPPQPNRYLLGRVKLHGGQGNADRKAEPDAATAACVPFNANDSALIDLLRSSELLAPFLSLSSKDNGFDMEGLAARDGTVYLGLRGPVLRGWASIIQLKPRPHRDAEGRKSLIVDRPRKTGNCYLHHLLDLGGLGIRDLCAWGKDLLILAGPTMELDGPVVVYRWHDAFGATTAQCLDDQRLELCFEVPWGVRKDHAEGIALFRQPGEKEPALLVVYDSPEKSRLHDGRYFVADLFRLV